MPFIWPYNARPVEVQPLQPIQGSKASVGRLTAAKRTLMVEGARFFCSRKNRYRRTTVRLKARRGSEPYQPMNSSMARRYDSWELAAASEFSTAFFDCSRSGRRRTVLDLDRFVVFCRRA